MIIMLNGSFGVGKTTIAELLIQKLPNLMLYDPEIVGSAIAEMTKGHLSNTEDTGDFQDIAVWPETVVKTAQVLRNQYKKDLVVPMTLDSPNRLNYIFVGFREIDPHVHHFCLTAPLGVILERIRSRAEGNGEWSQKRAVECSKRFTGSTFEKYIENNNKSVEAICGEIISHISD